MSNPYQSPASEARPRIASRKARSGFFTIMFAVVGFLPGGWFVLYQSFMQPPLAPGEGACGTAVLGGVLLLLIGAPIGAFFGSSIDFALRRHKQRRLGANYRERLFVARCALFVFITGLLALLSIGVLGSPWDQDGVVVPLPLAFGMIAEFLALLLGFLGRRHDSGKVAMVGGIFILALVLLVPLMGSTR